MLDIVDTNIAFLLVIVLATYSVIRLRKSRAGIGVDVKLSIVVLAACLFFWPQIKSPTDDPSDNKLRLPLRWGTFRSGHYFGLKKNEPASIVAGLMWFRNAIEGNTVPIRHWCSQFDGLPSYTWTKHDFDSFGQQTIVDKNFSITTRLIFLDHGWMTKVTLENTLKSGKEFDKPISLLFYVAKENESDDIYVSSRKGNKQLNNLIEIAGSTTKGVKFTSTVEILGPKRGVIYVHDLSTYTKPPLVNLKETILSNIHLARYEGSTTTDPLIVLSNQRAIKDQPPNLIAVQILISKPVDIMFYLTEKPHSTDMDSLKNQFENLISEKSFEFDQEFEKTFGLSSNGYEEKIIDFAKSALSNMIGSVGYFYGHSLVKKPGHSEPVLYGPLELVSGVPSRPFFPRGFLWDEGFHNLLIQSFKPRLSRVIINNWLNLMNDDGWIPREVILGYEAIARVPSEFIVQDETNGNPPTLFLSLESMMQSQLLDREYVESIFNRLELWYSWFNRTQIGPKPGTYRWHGRDSKALKELNPKTLSSGLDDYPRATHPTNKEIHLDLRCWMAFASKTMHSLASFINHPSAEVYANAASYLSDNELLDSLHWSETHQMYCDYGLHSNKVKLVKIPEKEISERKVEENPVYQCVPELGYVSIFPLMMELIKPDNPRLGKILDVLQNPEYLWTPFGIRSLSKSSNYYRKYNTDVDPPYWRGSIWINMNYLILRSLKHYSYMTGPYQEKARTIHDKLRANLVTNIYQSFQESGYIWEQYDDITGKGKGSHPFTGWSALVVMIMANKY